MSQLKRSYSLTDLNQSLEEDEVDTTSTVRRRAIPYQRNPSRDSMGSDIDSSYYAPPPPMRRSVESSYG